MDNMRKIYLEEADDLLSNLESALLTLDRDPSDQDAIEEAFRSMHTLKGNSSMFGFEKIASFIHNLETVYDQVREGKIPVTKELLDITLASLDHIRMIIDDHDLANVTNRETYDNLTKGITGIINSSNGAHGEELLPDNVEASAASGTITYYIRFIPDEDVFSNGTNPLYLLDELHSLGRCETIPHFKQGLSFKEYNPHHCITSWDIFLSTESNKDIIKDVFVFVEDECELEIHELHSSDLLGNNGFKELIIENTFAEEHLDLKHIMSFIDGLNGHTEILETPVREVMGNTEHKEKVVSSVRVSSDKLDGLMNIVSEMVTTQASLSLHAENHYNLQLETISENVETLTRQLRDIAFGMTLIPINNLFDRFQRMIRDLSNDMGKEVRLTTIGGETELDKTIIEKLSDPLMHILRNSLDHGIESGTERLNNGKSKEGKIELKAFYSGAYVNIQIVDDGKGIDPKIIRQKAVNKGLINESAVLSDKEIMDLIFAPGFSTAEKVTDLSGRGVGMDVVRSNIADLRGEVLIDSKVGLGTTLTLKLPLTLSIIDGLLVKVHETNFIIPLSVIDKCHEVNYSELLNSFNELLVLDNVQIPFLNLRSEFQDMEDPPEKSQVIVVNNGDRQVAVSVDHIIGEYQAVLKPLSKYYKEQEFISGATILGDGTIALVLDTNKIINDVINQLKEELV